MARKDKVKVVHPESWGSRLKWLIIAAIIIVLLTVVTNFTIKSCTDWGNKKYILNELQYGRNQLHLSIASSELNHRRKINVEFPYRYKVPEALDFENGLRVNQMYQALDNGTKEANILYDELGKDLQDKELIANRKKSILRSLETLDQIGPNVADYLGGVWRIPSKELSQQELVNDLERVIVTSSATGPTSTTVNSLKK